MMNKKRAKFLSFTTLSVLLHLFFFGGLILLENSIFMSELNKLLNHTVVDKTKDVVTQIELIDLEEEMLQVVQQNENSVDETEPVDADFLSIKNQNVEKQTKSALNGKFNNASDTPEGAQASVKESKDQQASKASTGSASKQSKKQQAIKKQVAKATSNPAPDIKNFGLNGLNPTLNPVQALNKQFVKEQREAKAQAEQKNASNNNSSDNRQASRKQKAIAAGGDGISQTDDYLEGIEEGDQTLLRTKEYKYYSFYSRVREQLRSNWNPMIRAKVSFLYSTGRSRELASNPLKKTSLRVTLNEKGYLESIELLKTSGITTIDKAAIDAFRAAAPFPNPPDGMKEKDEKVRIFWDFVLET